MPYMPYDHVHFGNISLFQPVLKSWHTWKMHFFSFLLSSFLKITLNYSIPTIGRIILKDYTVFVINLMLTVAKASRLR